MSNQSFCNSLVDTLVSKFFPPLPPYLLPVTRVARVGKRGMRFATRTCVRAQFITRDREMARGWCLLVDEITRRIPRFMEILGTPLWWPFASMPRLSDQRRNEKYHFNRASSPLHAPMSQFSRRDTGGILQSMVGRKLSLLTLYKHVVRISPFSSRAREDFEWAFRLVDGNSYFWKCCSFKC